MSDPLARVITPIVEGQLRSYLHDHPEIAAAYIGKWRPKGEGVVRSASKRILTDLLCAQTRVRLRAAVLAQTSEPASEKRTWRCLLRSLGARVALAMPSRLFFPSQGETP